MNADVIKVEALDNFTVRVELMDGRKGLLDIKPYLEWGAYQALKDPAYFRMVRVEHGVLCWPMDEDIAPETLEEDLQPLP